MGWKLLRLLYVLVNAFLQLAGAFYVMRAHLGAPMDIGVIGPILAIYAWLALNVALVEVCLYYSYIDYVVPPTLFRKPGLLAASFSLSAILSSIFMLPGALGRSVYAHVTCDPSLEDSHQPDA